jgi:hypothetical protein
MKPKVHSNLVRWLFFWSGIIATFAYRIIVIVNHFSKTWSLILWYIGTIGFIIYFVHRYQISETRAKLIENQHLDKKIANLNDLNPEDKDAISYIFGTLKSTREKWNYIFIFVVSFLALILGLYLDFFQK